MVRLIGSLALSLAVVGGISAQGPYQSRSRPPYSPYLNLFRGGSSPAVNYYGLVRPQQQAQRNFQQIQRDIDGTRRSFDFRQGQLERGLTTGTVSRFQTHGQYFQTHRFGGSPLGQRSSLFSSQRGRGGSFRPNASNRLRNRSSSSRFR